MRDSMKNKESERRRRDRLNDAFKNLAELLPTYDPAKTYAKMDVLEQSTQFIKELRLSSSRLLIDQTENDEKSKLIKELQDEVNKLILRVKQLTALLVRAKISIPNGPSLNILGNRRLKYSNKLTPDDLENEQNKSLHSTSNDIQPEPSTSIPLKEKLKNKEQKDLIEVIDLEPPTQNPPSDSQSPTTTPTTLINNLPLQTTIILTPCSIQQPQQIQMTRLTLQSHQILPKVNQKIPIQCIRKTIPVKKRKKRTIKPKIIPPPIPPKENSKESPLLNQTSSSKSESPEKANENMEEARTPTLIEITLSEEEDSSNLLETPKKLSDSFLPCTITKSPETPNLIEDINSDDSSDKSPKSKDSESTSSLLKRKLNSDHDYDMPKKISSESIEPLNNKDLEEIMENEGEKEFETTREPSPSILNENDPQIVLLTNSPQQPRRSNGENILLCSTQSKDPSRLENEDDIEMMNLSENGKEKRKDENSHNQHAHSIAELIPLHIEDHSHDKISECIARSIGLIDPPEGLMELGPDWSDTTKSPISPTQMFLSMFPLLPREAENSKNSQFITGIGSSGSKSSFFIDAMLPDDTNFPPRSIPLTPISTCLAMTPNLTENLTQSFSSFTDSLVNCLSITPGFSSFPSSSTNELGNLKNQEMESVHRELFNFNSPHVTSSSLPPIPPAPPTHISSVSPGVSNPSGVTPSARHHRSHSTGHRPSQTLSSTINSSVTFADIFNPIINASANTSSTQSNHSTSSILSTSNNIQSNILSNAQRNPNMSESNEERFYHQNNERSFSHENLFAHQLLGGLGEEENPSVHGSQRRDSVQIYHPFDIGNERENRQPYYTSLSNPVQPGSNNSKSSSTPQHHNPSQQNEQNKQTINFRPATMTDNYEMTSHTPNQKRSTSLPTIQQNVQQQPHQQMTFNSASNAPIMTNNENRGKSQQQHQFFRSNSINISQSGSFTPHSHPPTISSSDEQINKGIVSIINTNTNRNYQIHQQQQQIAQPQGNFQQQQMQPTSSNSKSRKNQNSFSRNSKNATNSQIDFAIGTLSNNNNTSNSTSICQGTQQKGRNASVQNQSSHLSQRASQGSEFPNFTFHSMLNDTPSISVSTNQFDLIPRQSQTRSQQKRPYYLPESAQIVHNLPHFDLPFLQQGSTNSQQAQQSHHKQQGKDQQLPPQQQPIQAQQQQKSTPSISPFNSSSPHNRNQTSKLYPNTGNSNNFNQNIQHCQAQPQQYSHQQQQQQAQPCQNISFNPQSQEIPILPLPPLPVRSNSSTASNRASASMNQQQQPIQKSKQSNSGYNTGRSNNNGNNNANNSRPVNWMTDQPPYRKSSPSANTFSVSKLVGNPSGGSAGQAPSTFSAFSGSNYYAESLLRKSNDWNDINFVPPPASPQVPQFVYQPTQNNAEYNFHGQNYQSSGNQHFNFDNSNFQSSNSSSVSNFNMSSIFPEIEKRSSGNSGGNNPNNCYYPGPPNI